MKTIAVIGTGIMGRGIATNFLKNGYKVIVWNRSPEKLEDLIKNGAIAASNPKDATSQAEIIFEVTANDESSKSVWLGAQGILAGAYSTKTLITSSTLSVPWVDSLAKQCSDLGFTFFDMPMTGGRVGAETGQLELLVGGDEQKLASLENDLKAISAKVFYFGKAGSGMRYKLILNMVQGIHIVTFGEALRLAQEMGLDIKKTGDTLAQRPGGTTTNIAWRDFQTKPQPINFSVDWITKDLNYAKESAHGISTPLLDLALEKYKEVIQKGMGEEDWTAVNS